MTAIDQLYEAVKSDRAKYIDLLRACYYHFGNKIGHCLKFGCQKDTPCHDCKKEENLSAKIKELLGDEW